MIAPDDNGKKNYERVKRWREKNRALVNLKQRNYRREKKNLPVPVLAEPQRPDHTTVGTGDGEARESTSEVAAAVRSADFRGGRTFKDETLERLKGLIKVEQERPRVEVPAPVKRVYRTETGMVITKDQWEEREAEKSKARSKGFEIDEYSQA